jgi:hypothetical protein
MNIFALIRDLKYLPQLEATGTDTEHVAARVRCRRSATASGAIGRHHHGRRSQRARTGADSALREMGLSGEAGAMIQVVLINESTVVTAAEAMKGAAALNTQLARDLAPAWGIEATIAYCADPRTAPLAAWQLVILDNSDQAGALGYHDLTPAGLPLGKVFAKDDLTDGVAWSVTASHELLEMLADPEIDQCVQDGDGDRFVALELCDACEDDQFAYAIDGVKVSDFTLRNYFRAGAPGPYDFGGHIPGPLQIIAGGYLGIYQNGQWSQVTAQLASGAETRAQRSVRTGRSRFLLRETPRQARRRSVVMS